VGTDDWSSYYDAAQSGSPRTTLLQALDRFDAGPGPPGGRFAVDLGCGEGRDTVELLRRGWRVLAIDAEPDAIVRLLARPEATGSDRLEAMVSSFEEADWPETALVNASYSLPFCPPETFPGVWEHIVESLPPGGRFCGQLFGDRDEWASDPALTTQRRVDVERLLGPFEVERLSEIEEDGETALGVPKHWHLFHVIARKT
jgi:tellurite methyltransferase